ncbi:MAG: DUF1800 family protein [Burkholderiales bacterium]
MQGETRLAKQGASRFNGWRNGLIAVVAVAVGLSAGVAQAQRNNNPTVSLSASATSIMTGASAVLTATASDSDGYVVAVTFYDGGVQVAQKTTAPYTYTFSTMSTGAHTFTAVATDNKLGQSSSAPVTITVMQGGNIPPTVSLTASSTTLAAGTATLLHANAADLDGTVAKVVFMNGATMLGQATSAPFDFNWYPQTEGTFSITAIATDDAAASTTSNAVAITVTAAGAPRDNKPPTVSLNAASTSVQVNTATLLTANAADPDGTISKVEFYNGATLAATDTSSPYQYNFTPTAAGTYQMTARAYDNWGVPTTSNTVSIVASTTPPAAALPRITLGINNTLVTPGTTITLTGTAAATAPATVSRVSFYMNGNKLVDDTVSPYSTTVVLPSVGVYTFRAEVADSSGQIVSTLTQTAVAGSAPPVATTSADVWRFLNQATFGASQAEAARVLAMGMDNWITDQMAQPVSGYPDSKYNRIQLGNTADCTTTMPSGAAYPGDSPQAVCARDHLTLAMVQRDFYTNAVYAPDQLRQRVAWALSQIIVTSANEPDLSFAHVMSRYQNLMFQEAFGNYRTLLQKVTYNPAMGNYLDAVNNDRPAGTRVPNENYAREIMQLFSVGLHKLNLDGTPIMDPTTGMPADTYGQTEIAEFARVFTGYTYANAAGTPATGKQGRYYGAPMVPYPTTSTTGHDPNAKTLLNYTGAVYQLPAGQTGAQDMDAAVDNVFNHPNTAPFVSKQLIQRLVTGDPSPAYVARIATVFNNNKANPNQLGAVVRAILMDAEARGPSKAAVANFGQLKEPVLMVTGLLRALNALTDGSRLEGATGNLGQRPYYSPTVFNYFMPDAKVPGTSIVGPEFGIHTTVTAVGRANLVYALVYGGYNPDTTIPGASGTKLFLAPFEAVADNPAAMVSLVNQHLAGGQFPASLEPTIVTAVNAITLSATPTAAERTARARMAVYLMASSYDYQVQR